METWQQLNIHKHTYIHWQIINSNRHQTTEKCNNQRTDKTDYHIKPIATFNSNDVCTFPLAKLNNVRAILFEVNEWTFCSCQIIGKARRLFNESIKTEHSICINCNHQRAQCHNVLKKLWCNYAHKLCRFAQTRMNKSNMQHKYLLCFPIFFQESEQTKLYWKVQSSKRDYLTWFDIPFIVSVS
jgi:hypothetical protein